MVGITRTLIIIAWMNAQYSLLYCQSDDIPTFRLGSNAGSLENMILERMVGATPDAKQVTLTLIISQSPTVYFDYYDSEKKALVIDLFDTRVGDSNLDPIIEHPIKKSSLENIEIDLNKDVVGMKPDMREAVRLSLYSDSPFPYSIEEELGVLTLTFRWSRRLEKKWTGAKRAIYWKFPAVMAVVAGTGYFIWTVCCQSDTKGELNPILDAVGKSPPVHPK